MRPSLLVLAVTSIGLVSCDRPAPGGASSPAVARAAAVAATTTAFHVTQTTVHSQDHPAVATNDEGKFWVVWHTDEAASTSGLDIKARVFDATAVPLGDEFVVHEVRGKNQMYPDVAADRRGRFAVAWMEQTTAETYDVYGRVFWASGRPLTQAFKVSTFPSHARSWPSLAMYPNGDMLFIWDDSPAEYVNVYVRLFAVDGRPRSDATVINLAELNSPRDTNFEHLSTVVPDVAVDASGWAFGAWRRFEGATVSVVGRLFNPYTGVWLEETAFSPPAYGVIQQRPTVDINGRGDALVAWTEWYPFGASKVVMRKYDGATDTWGTAWKAAAEDPNPQSKIIAVLGEGGQVAAAWTGFRSGTREDIYMRVFDPLGTALTKAVRVNDYTTGKQDRPAIALMGARLLTAWESWGEDGDDRGVYARILERAR